MNATTSSRPPFSFGEKRNGKNEIFVNMDKLLAIGLRANNISDLKNILGAAGENDMLLLMKSLQFVQPVFVDGIIQLTKTGDLKNFGFAVFENNTPDFVKDILFIRNHFDKIGNIPSNAWDIIQYFSINVTDNHDKPLHEFKVSINIIFESQAGKNASTLVMDPPTLQDSVLLVV